MADPFPYKTQPMPRQRDALQRSVAAPYFALHMEQGTGKTFVTIITAAYLFLRKKIDAVIIIAPNGVYQGWVLDQFPEHCPDVVPWRAHLWNSGKALRDWRKSKKLRPKERTWEIGDLARDRSVLAVLALNTDAATTPMGAKAIGTFLTMRRCLLVLDEAGDFTTPSAKRTRAVQGYAKRAPYRRILEGVPVSTSPFELYAPFRFLSPSILGYRTYQEMKDAHAEWEERERFDGYDPTTGAERKRLFKVVAVDPGTGKKKWKDLDVLARRIAPYTYRCTKAEALPDLPPKIFHKRYFELTAEQWRMTHELHEQLITEFADGATVTAAIILTQYLRFQQITCGYLPPDQVYGEETEPERLLSGPNPRLELALEEVERHRAVPQIIWTRFKMDLTLLVPRLRDEGFRVWTYTGETPEAERAEARDRFQRSAEPGDVLVGNPAAGGRGLNLYRAEHVLYYANYFGLRRRLQSEDRPHRIGTKRAVNYTDLLGRASIDHVIVRALRHNHDVADIITGDPAKDWL